MAREELSDAENSQGHFIWGVQARVTSSGVPLELQKALNPLHSSSYEGQEHLLLQGTSPTLGQMKCPCPAAGLRDTVLKFPCVFSN